MHRLKLRVKTPGSQKAVTLDRFPVVLGTDDSADIQVPDRFVCPKHCEITNVNGRLFLRDLGAEYGTFLNRRPVKRESLRCGDKFGVGFTTFLVEEIILTPEVDAASRP